MSGEFNRNGPFGEKNTGYGWEGFIKENNPWAKYAEEHYVDFSDKEIKPVKHSKFKTIALGKVPKINRKVFAKSPWTEWYKRKIEVPISFTVPEYKRAFKGSLPNYALSFKRQSVDLDYINTNIRSSFVLGEPYGDKKIWHIERERYLNFQKKHERIYIERLYNLGGRLTDVTLLHFFGTNDAFVTHNYKISHQKWASEELHVWVDPYPPIPYQKYLKLQTPWQFNEI